MIAEELIGHTLHRSTRDKVAISADGSTIAVVSQSTADTKGVLTVYQHTDTYKEITTLQSEVANDGYGCSVAISGDGNVIVIGANAKYGSVYVYAYMGNSYQLVDILLTDIEYGLKFGSSVAIDADGLTIAVGSSGGKHNSSYVPGLTQIYTYVNGRYILTYRIIKPDGIWGNYVTAISGDGKVIAIGATNIGDNYRIKRCEVTVHRRVGEIWVQEAVLTPSSRVYTCGYGSALVIDENGSTIAVGDYTNIYSYDFNPGAVYVFRYNDLKYKEIGKLQYAEDSSNGCFSGEMSISKDGNRILISDYVFRHTEPQQLGRIYLYELTDRWLKHSINSNDTKYHSELGTSVSINGEGNTIVVNALMVSDIGGYIFHI